MTSCHLSKRQSTKEHTVLVVGKKFDEDLEVFKGKVVGKYTIKCSNNYLKYDIYKKTKKHIKFLTQKEFNEIMYKHLRSGYYDETCEVVEGVSEHSGKNILSSEQRLKWNAAIKKRDFSNFSNKEIKEYEKKIAKIQNVEGTAVAGIVAYRNPKVKLVFVELENSEVEEHVDIDAYLKEECSKGSDLEHFFLKWRQALKYLHISKMFKIRNFNREREIYGIARKHNVTLVSKEYRHLGTMRAIEDYYNSFCPYYGEFLVTRYRLEFEQRRNMGLLNPEVAHLTIQSVGDGSSELNISRDDPECTLNLAENRLYVGSFDYTNRVSSFSNFGTCTDLYMPGSKIISVLPGGVLYPLNGTRFAAPLAVRYLSFHEVKRGNEMKEWILNQRDNKRFIKVDSRHMKDISFEFGKEMNLHRYLKEFSLDNRS